MVLGMEGRMTDALESAERTVAEAEAADDPEALADAYFVMGVAYGELGKEGGLAFMQRSLEAYQRSGNLARQADTLSSLGDTCATGRVAGTRPCPTGIGVAWKH